MAVHSKYLSSLTKEQRNSLQTRLLELQSGKCFICGGEIDPILHAGHLEVDHVQPLADQGADEENNFALVHDLCNREKGVSDLRVARRMKEFDLLQDQARTEGARGANLGHVLARYHGAAAQLRLARSKDEVRFALPDVGDNRVRTLPLYRDPLSEMDYFFTVLPLQYLHHDDRINPRSIGSNIRALLEEFMRKRPQLHVGLAWWKPESDGTGPVRVFDGQHKAAAQILLGAHELPVRVFVEPDLNVLLQANTNAGDKLRQVAFDMAVLRKLGSSLYEERVRQYQQMKGLGENEFGFSETDLVTFFRGEHREMQRYIVDALRSQVVRNKDNRLLEFVEWAGKVADRPISYATVERTFFKWFLYKKALDSPMDEGIESGSHPRTLEVEQLVRLMNLFADAFFVGKWEPEVGGRRIEAQVQKGEKISEGHLRAWRIGREEIFANVLRWVRLVIEYYFVYTGKVLDNERPFHVRIPEECWQRIESFLVRLAALPCWIDRSLSITVFGAKQNVDFWRTVFEKGVGPNGVRVLAEPLDLSKMIQSQVATKGN